ncbi:MAG: hypothetical protein IKC11_03290 [Clostridia bacterium]|nr:hypothetical protein [Clostridia bacterium]
MKKLFKLFATCFVALCLMVTGGLLAGCKKDNADAMLKRVKDMYGFASMTSAVLLSEYQNEPVSSFNVNTDLTYEKIVDAVDGHIKVFEGIIGGKKPVSSKMVESDNGNYASKMVIEYSDITGEESTFLFYFEENSLGAEPDHIFDPDDYEYSTTITGVIKKQGDSNFEEITVNGEKIVEEDEMEILLSFMVGDYKVEYAQESEDDEQEFSYVIYQGSTLIKNFSFGMEVERNEIEVEYFLEYGDNIYAFEVEQVKRFGKDVLEISGTVGDGTFYDIIVLVEQEEGVVTNTYIFPDGTRVKKVRS